MSENVQTAMLEILKKIQAQLSEHDKRFDTVEKRFDELGDLVRKQRRDTAGLLVMAKSITGNFAEVTIARHQLRKVTVSEPDADTESLVVDFVHAISAPVDVYR